MNVTRDALLSMMVPAVRNAVGSRWPAIQELVEAELRKLAEDLLDIHWMLDAEKIDVGRAKKLLHVHQMTVRSVLCAVKGIGLKTAEQVPLVATRAVGGVINELVGFPLISGGNPVPRPKDRKKQNLPWGRKAPKSQTSEESAERSSSFPTPDFRAGKDI